MRRENNPAIRATVGEALAQAQAMTVTPITAGAILAHVTGRDRAWQLAHPDAPLSPEQAAEVRALLDRAAQGEPLAYLTGEREFFGLPFIVTPAVLIPRPETELLVEVALKWVEERGRRAPRLVDVGTGSGALTVTLAVKLPQARITATECSPEALAVARRNAARHGVEDRVRFVQADLLDILPGPFDAILANLPYIPSGVLKTLDVSRWEPWEALDGGPDGLDAIRALIRQSPARLGQGGLLALEIQHDQGRRVSTLCREAFPGAHVTVERDLAHLDRVVKVELP